VATSRYRSEKSSSHLQNVADRQNVRDFLSAHGGIKSSYPQEFLASSRARMLDCALRAIGYQYFRRISRMENASISNHRVLPASMSMAVLVLGACAAQTVKEDDPGEKDNSEVTVTGSRLPIRDTNSAIGVKTVDQESLERMMRVIPGPDGR
jgi:hypothetical protein